MGVLMRVVDRVVVLDHGEVIFAGAKAGGGAGERARDRGTQRMSLLRMGGEGR